MWQDDGTHFPRKTVGSTTIGRKEGVILTQTEILKTFLKSGQIHGYVKEGTDPFLLVSFKVLMVEKETIEKELPGIVMRINGHDERGVKWVSIYRENADRFLNFLLGTPGVKRYESHIIRGLNFHARVLAKEKVTSMHLYYGPAFKLETTPDDEPLHVQLFKTRGWIDVSRYEKERVIQLVVGFTGTVEEMKPVIDYLTEMTGKAPKTHRNRTGRVGTILSGTPAREYLKTAREHILDNRREIIDKYLALPLCKDGGSALSDEEFSAILKESNELSGKFKQGGRTT